MISIYLLLLSLVAGTRAECSGLGCSLVGQFHWRNEADGINLRLNVTAEEAEVANGTLTHGGQTEVVNASLAFSRGGREALIKWRVAETKATGATWNGLFLVGCRCSK